ncbi:MAG: hypothetical protein ABR511_03500 [Acidimicrobiales bacterium]
MSYLNPLRLHFAGSFQAAISTVNNDPVHFDTATFQPSYQQMQTATDPNGWFNPRGSGDWRLIGCRVTAAFGADGAPAAADDAVRAMVVADSDRAVPAKLVDLDPEQQLVSTIWGLEVRIATAGGDTVVRGRFSPVAFTDIWDRGHGQGAAGDVGAGAAYQSVLTDLEWADVGSSAFLGALRAAAADGLLSVKFNVDGINLDFTSPDFMTGRIVGTIGPAAKGGPHHFVPGRQFMTTAGPGGNFFAPAGGVNFCVATVDHHTRRVYLDLGNALPTNGPGGPPLDVGEVALYQFPPPDQSSQPLLLGSVPSATYTDPAWYPATAGVVAFPADRPLTGAELDRVDGNPLAVVLTPAGGQPTVAITEPPGGVFVRADQFVYRLNPGEEATVRLYATRFGHPHRGEAVLTVPVPQQLQPFSALGPAPAVATPADAVDYPVRVVTDGHGVAHLTLRAGDPGTPRGYIDGQVYALYPVLEETVVSPTAPYPYNQWNFVSLLVWSGFHPDDPPTWFGSIQPVLQQYANLYPVMDRFLDLGDYDSVCANLGLLQLAFGLDLADPNSMPVTRDLSTAKRATILRWLSEPGDGGRPRKGTPPAAVAAEPQVAAEGPPGPEALGAARAHAQMGGKASAAARRLVARRVAPPGAGRAGLLAPVDGGGRP